MAKKSKRRSRIRKGATRNSATRRRSRSRRPSRSRKSVRKGVRKSVRKSVRKVPSKTPRITMLIDPPESKEEKLPHGIYEIGYPAYGYRKYFETWANYFVKNPEAFFDITKLDLYKYQGEPVQDEHGNLRRIRAGVDYASKLELSNFIINVVRNELLNLHNATDEEKTIDHYLRKIEEALHERGLNFGDYLVFGTPLRVELKKRLSDEYSDFVLMLKNVTRFPQPNYPIY